MPTQLIDLANQLVCDASIRPQAALTSTTNGGGIDMQLADGPVHLLVTIGVSDFSSGDEKMIVKLQESDTSGGTYSDIAGVPSVTWDAAASDTQNTSKFVSTNQRAKRWVRAVATISGTTPSFFTTALVASQKKILGGSGTQL